jgi:hypothetical protein
MCEAGQITPHSGAEITNSAHQKARQPQKTRVFAHKTVGTAFATAVEHNLLWELHKMKKTLLAVALASSLTSFGAVAADKAPEPSYTLTGNIGLVSDYRFRGVSQTQKGPAVQGGLDLALANGLSFGTWTSNVSQWANLGGSQEIDLYGSPVLGFRSAVSPIGIRETNKALPVLHQTTPLNTFWDSHTDPWPTKSQWQMETGLALKLTVQPITT